MIVLDRVLARASVNGRDLRLRLMEYRLLSYLAHAERQVSRAELMAAIFGVNFIPETNTLAVTLSRLRSQLPDPTVIVTDKGNGYSIAHGAVTVER